jgi:hypothetical protein
VLHLILRGVVAQREPESSRQHLHYIDRMRMRTFASIRNFNRFWHRKRIGDIRAELSSTRSAMSA